VPVLISFSNWQPCDEVQQRWLEVTGNTVDGLGEAEPRHPTPVMWRNPSIIPFGEVQKWFAARSNTHKNIAKFGKTGEAGDRQLPPVANTRADWNAERWTKEVKVAALAAGAELVGIARMQPE